jgi:hypothetical protein
MMTDILARAYVVSRLDDAQVHALHAIEKRGSSHMVPAWIHERFNTEPFKEVSEDSQMAVSATVHAIFGSVEGRAKARQEFMGPRDYEAFDWEVRKRGLNFVSSGGSSNRQRLLDGERCAA